MRALCLLINYKLILDKKLYPIKIYLEFSGYKNDPCFIFI